MTILLTLTSADAGRQRDTLTPQYQVFSAGKLLEETFKAKSVSPPL